MPNAQGHHHLTIAALVLSTPIYMVVDWPMALAFQSGVVVTLLPEFTPDLDISHRRFGVIGELVGLRAYSRLVPHRAGLGKIHWTRLRVWHIFLFSHIPLAGTLLRTLILTTPLLLMMFLLDIWPVDGLWLWVWLWLGMSWSDCWHVVADIITSDYKEMSRGWWTQSKSSRSRPW